MIPRYTHSEIAEIWSDTYRFKTFLKVELAHLRSLEGTLVPKGTANDISKKVKIDPSRIELLERETHHDVIAFITSITEQLTKDESRYFHFGLTSSDIIDTALSLQIRDSLHLITNELELLLDAFSKRIIEHEKTLCIGRSHGIQAEPTSFGIKLLGHYAEFKRRINELKRFMEEDLTAQFSGAIGSYSITSPERELTAAKELGLNVETVSTQVIPRDRHAKLASILALLAQAIERIAVEFRHLQRSEVGEIQEGFSKGQKGSSTMPHKKNPISCENLTGLARVIRSNLQIALDNTILWHERDISHSSAERIYLPDTLGLCYYAIKRLTNTLECLVIDTKRMTENALKNDKYLSSYYLHFLIEYTELSRDQIYPIVQQAAFSEGSLRKVLESKLNLELPDLNEEKIREIYLKHTYTILKRSKILI